MLSSKMTVSLMSLITIIALSFSVTPAMAAPPADHGPGLGHGGFPTGHAHFDTTLSYDEAENVDGREVDVTIEFGKVTSLAAVQATTVTVIIVNDDFKSTTYYIGEDADGTHAVYTVNTAGVLTVADTEWTAVLLSFGQKDIDPSTAGDQSDGKTFTFTIPSVKLLRAGFAAADGRAAADQTVSASKIYVSIPGGIPSLDPADADTSNHATMAIDLRTVATTQDRETPAVVSIQRLRPGSQTVVAAFQEAAVTGPFTVRVVLSETPHDAANFAGKINVTNAIKSGFVIGTPFLRHGGLTGANATPASAPIPGQTIRPHPIEGRYNHDGVVTPSFGDTTETAPIILPWGVCQRVWMKRMFRCRRVLRVCIGNAVLRLHRIAEQTMS